MMTMRHERINGRSTGTTAVLSGLRVVLAAIAGLALMLSALVLGFVLGAVVLLCKLLGGRSRVAYFCWRDAKTRSRPGATQSDVIDVEVREVTMRDTHNS